MTARLTGCPACTADSLIALPGAVEAALDANNGLIFCASSTTTTSTSTTTTTILAGSASAAFLDGYPR